MWKNARQISLAWYFCERRNGNLDKNCAGLATKVLFELPLQERVTQIYKALSISKEWAIADIFVSKMKTLSVDLWEEWKLIMLKVGWSFWGPFKFHRPASYCSGFFSANKDSADWKLQDFIRQCGLILNPHWNFYYFCTNIF